MDNSVIAAVPDMGKDDVSRAIDTAHLAFKEYKKMPPRQRRFLLRKWSDLIKENADDLAALCTMELAKPYSESHVTINYGVSFLDWFECEAEHLYGETIPAARGDNRIFTIREPQGVVCAVLPWNSPIAMLTRKVGAAIAAGNTVICKPAPETPFTALALASLFERAGFPKGVLNIVTTLKHVQEVGTEMCTNPKVKHLSFTGSTAIGKMLHQLCAQSLKKTSMELGGNAPFIVFADCDVDKAVDGVITSKFRSSGQTCVCANRIFVESSIYDTFATKLAARQKELLKPGSVWEKGINYGPLYSDKGLQKVKLHVEDALQKGAKVFLGGNPRTRNSGQTISHLPFSQA